MDFKKLHNEFVDNKGVLTIKNPLEKNVFSLLQQNAKDLLESGLKMGDDWVPDRYVSYNHDYFVKIHKKFVDVVSDIVGIEVIPTYTYFISYIKGSELRPHVDRGSCEFTIILSLLSTANKIWTLYVGDKKVDLDVGDILLYKGEIEHWRDPLPDGQVTNLLLHYVNKNYGGKLG